jgi:predicted dienelactone hydrolase
MPSVKQAPVIQRLHYLMREAAAVAAAVRDNAQDDGEPLDPAELIDLIADYQIVLDLLDEAFNVQPARVSGACSIG